MVSVRKSSSGRSLNVIVSWYKEYSPWIMTSKLGLGCIVSIVKSWTINIFKDQFLQNGVYSYIIKSLKQQAMIYSLDLQNFR